MEQNIFMCIDLKSFFASVECADRGLDPFTANLVVSDPSRGNGAICLAITPAMKALGIRNRCRIFEIPPGVQYITALPRMKRYMEVSAQVYGMYLRYISPEDIHVYSMLHRRNAVPRHVQYFSEAARADPDERGL